MSVAGENRLWLGRLELVGPLRSVRVECGPLGDTLVRADLIVGERRTIDVPLPLRAPLGSESLGLLPVPDVVVDGEGSARFLGFSESQPVEALADVPPGLAARTRPPARGVEVETGAAEALVLVAACALVVALRRRAWLALGAAALAACAVVALVRAGVDADTTTEVLELDLAAGVGVLVRSTGGALAASPHGLEVVPSGGPLAFQVDVDEAPAFVARAGAGATLVALSRRAPPAELETGPPRWERAAVGSWTLRPDAPGFERSPPGWLAAGLPPGVAVVVGRSEGGRWVRATLP